ncbi:MAG: hypothetical protein ACLFQV_08185 [Vulcanimicrobiota bacterium]
MRKKLWFFLILVSVFFMPVSAQETGPTAVVKNLYVAVESGDRSRVAGMISRDTLVEMKQKGKHKALNSLLDLSSAVSQGVIILRFTNMSVEMEKTDEINALAVVTHTVEARKGSEDIKYPGKDRIILKKEDTGWKITGFESLN